MANAVRDQIIKAVTAAVAASFSQTPSRWRKTPRFPHEVESIEVRDMSPADAAEAVSGPGSVMTRTLDAEISVSFIGNVPIEQARAAKQQVWNAFAPDETLGGLVLGCAATGSEIETAQKENAVAAVKARVELLYQTPKWEN